MHDDGDSGGSRVEGPMVGVASVDWMLCMQRRFCLHDHGDAALHFLRNRDGRYLHYSCLDPCVEPVVRPAATILHRVCVSNARNKASLYGVGVASISRQARRFPKCSHRLVRLATGARLMDTRW